MQAKPLLLVAALITFPATAFAQAAPDQPAPTPTAAPAIAPVTLADLTPKATVYDGTGAVVGTIESVTSAGAVVSTGTARAEIPVASFARNANGLVIGMTKAQLEAAVAKASAK